MSCGVSASENNRRLDFEALWTSVDDALYEAKRGGRNRVSVAGAVGPVAAVPLRAGVA